MFNISDKVVCVDDSEPWIGWDSWNEPLKRGRVYVIREVRTEGAKYGCLLVGIYGDVCPFTNEEFGFLQHRFRKLEDIKEENRKKQEEPQPV